VTMKTRLSV